MPRPKGAGRLDQRLGRVSSRILEEIEREYDSGQKAKFIRRIRNMQARVYKMAMADGGCIGLGETAPPPALVMSQVMSNMATAEEVIARIREREQKIDAGAQVLFKALVVGDGGEERDNRPTEIVVHYHKDVQPSGDLPQQATEPGSPSAKAGE